MWLWFGVLKPHCIDLLLSACLLTHFHCKEAEKKYIDNGYTCYHLMQSLSYCQVKGRRKGLCEQFAGLNVDIKFHN